MSTPQLRPYQLAAIESIRTHWSAGRNNVCLVMPVGGGKTLTAAHMIKRALTESPDVDVFFLAHRIELIDQPSRIFTKLGIKHGVIKAGVKPDVHARVQIASVQTLANREVEAYTASGTKPGRYALIIPDEFHRYKAQSNRRIVRELKRSYSDSFTVGLTATPYRLDGQGLQDVADALVEAATPPQLIADGFITEGTVIGRPLPDPIDPRAIDDSGEYLEAAAEAAMDRPALLGDTVDTWRRHCEGWPGIGRCTSKHSAMLRLERFRAAGFRVGFLDGETPAGERRLLLARLAIGGQRLGHPAGLDVLLFVNVLTEGYDSESSYELLFLPEIRKVIWPTASAPPPYQPLCVLGDYAPTKSMGAFIQFWGRGSRTHRDKPWLRFLSHAGNEDEHCFLSKHHGFTLEHRQSEWLSKLREREAAQGVKVGGGYVAGVKCQECGTRWAMLEGGGVPESCLHCGCRELGAVVRSVSEGRSEEEAAGELVEKQAAAEAKRPPTPAELDSWFDGEFRKLRAHNAEAVSDGLRSRVWKVGMIVKKFMGTFGRTYEQVPWDVYRRYKRMYGFEGGGVGR